MLRSFADTAVEARTAHALRKRGLKRSEDAIATDANATADEQPAKRAKDNSQSASRTLELLFARAHGS
jgi:transcriptional regulator